MLRARFLLIWCIFFLLPAQLSKLDLLASLPPRMNPLILQPGEELPIRTDDISRAEIGSAIKSLKTGKSTGVDNIFSEAIQAGGVVSVDAMYSILNKFWRNEEIPEEWKKGLLVKLPKKGAGLCRGTYKVCTGLIVEG